MPIHPGFAHMTTEDDYGHEKKNMWHFRLKMKFWDWSQNFKNKPDFKKGKYSEIKLKFGIIVNANQSKNKTHTFYVVLLLTVGKWVNLRFTFANFHNLCQLY